MIRGYTMKPGEHLTRDDDTRHHLPHGVASDSSLEVGSSFLTIHGEHANMIKKNDVVSPTKD